MKKILLIALLFLSVKFIYADQLAWITKEQAIKTVEYFNEHDIKSVVLWCACCDNDPKLKVKVSRIYYKAVEGYTYYEVWIEGKDPEGKRLKQAVDLAYVHVKKDGEYNCLGKLLEFECDPCTKPFKL